MDVTLTVPDDHLTPQEATLIEHMRKALASFNYSVNNPRGKNYVVEGVVYTQPLRIDFKAHEPGKIGQAYLGPLLPLTANLFDGEGLEQSFRESIEAAFDAFVDHLTRRNA